MRRTTTNATIDVMKQVSSEYRELKTVMSEDHHFQSICKSIQLWPHHIKPGYPQNNGKIEWMVQTVKQHLKKCMAARNEPYLAMLIYRASPFSCSLPAPSELLNGRRYRTLLPTRSLMQNAHRQIVREQIIKNKERSTEFYRSARHLPPLSMQPDVHVQVDPKQNQ